MEEKWFCFIQEANFHIIDKQLLILLSNGHVVSRNSGMIPKDTLSQKRSLH